MSTRIIVDKLAPSTTFWRWFQKRLEHVATSGSRWFPHLENGRLILNMDCFAAGRVLSTAMEIGFDRRGLHAAGAKVLIWYFVTISPAQTLQIPSVTRSARCMSVCNRRVRPGGTVRDSYAPGPMGLERTVAKLVDPPTWREMPPRADPCVTPVSPEYTFAPDGYPQQHT